jgi:hypothetical protein
LVSDQIMPSTSSKAAEAAINVSGMPLSIAAKAWLIESYWKAMDDRSNGAAGALSRALALRKAAATEADRIANIVAPVGLVWSIYNSVKGVFSSSSSATPAPAAAGTPSAAAGSPSRLGSFRSASEAESMSLGDVAANLNGDGGISARAAAVDLSSIDAEAVDDGDADTASVFGDATDEDADVSSSGDDLSVGWGSGFGRPPRPGEPQYLLHPWLRPLYSTSGSGKAGITRVQVAGSLFEYGAPLLQADVSVAKGGVRLIRVTSTDDSDETEDSTVTSKTLPIFGASAQTSYLAPSSSSMRSLLAAPAGAAVSSSSAATAAAAARAHVQAHAATGREPDASPSHPGASSTLSTSTSASTSLATAALTLAGAARVATAVARWRRVRRGVARLAAAGSLGDAAAGAV